jgi:hypothetical protein
VADESKICRVCGSILDIVADPLPVVPAVAEDDAPAISHQVDECVSLADLAERATEWEEIDPRRWVCPNCREEVEHNFDICWKCGTDREGVSDLEFVADEQGPQELQAAEDITRPEPACSCVRCGSLRVVPNAAIYDQGQHSDGKLYAVIVGNPEALLFRDRMFGEIRADICGDCGHVEFHALHAARLYQHYLQSQE